ncbi:C2 domain containing protein [Entamoeba histolytica KU27]|uniref:C2 domain containing protein n=1 Tax=Entamoeba histolytica KU27 TaxID=885311 RepID=M2R5A8_ENTHI|nr:C2 domain containing protein [Entamoeba histolytica KU27]
MIKIELKIIEAKNLKGSDFCGLSSDPYCKVISRQCTQQTHVCKMTRNPSWNKSFNMDVTIGEDLRFEVYDYDNFGKNDNLGSTHYRVLGGSPGQVVDTWLGLSKKGEIHIQIIYGLTVGAPVHRCPPPVGAYPPPPMGGCPPPMGAYPPPPMGGCPPPMPGPGGYPMGGCPPPMPGPGGYPMGGCPPPMPGPGGYPMGGCPPPYYNPF